MAERWVVNASPVILLAKAGVIHFLPQLCDELVVPAGVLGEVQDARTSDTGRIWLQGEGERFVRATSPIHPALLNWRGGAGEAEVISWALHNPGFTAILDDRRARAWPLVTASRFSAHSALLSSPSSAASSPPPSLPWRDCVGLGLGSATSSSIAPSPLQVNLDLAAYSWWTISWQSDASVLERVARANGWAARRRRDRMGLRKERQEGKKVSACPVFILDWA